MQSKKQPPEFQDCQQIKEALIDSGTSANQPWGNFFLTQHVYLCATHDGVVLLDLKRDKYFGLGGAQLHAIASLVRDWPVPPPLQPGSEELPLQDAMQIGDMLVSMDLLTRDEAAGKLPRPLTLTSDGVVTALGQDVEYHRDIKVSDVIRFIASCVSAAWDLHARSLQRAVERAQIRRARNSRTPFDERKAAELVGVFRRIRAYVFVAKGKCLFHSLALTNFLARYDVFPTWVIGVRSSPFAAHSWVQHGNHVLDGTPELVSFYKPILAA